jgi:hypothetical protein
MTHRHTTLGRTPLNEWPTGRSTYTTHKKQKRRTSMPSAWFESAIPAIERPQTYYALDPTATVIGIRYVSYKITQLWSRHIIVVDYKLWVNRFTSLDGRESMIPSSYPGATSLGQVCFYKTDTCLCLHMHPATTTTAWPNCTKIVVKAVATS